MSENQLNHKPTLIVLSDLWGKENADWMSYYINGLENHYTIHFYDCCTLGNIDTSDFTELKLHNQFVNGGIDRAVKNLLQIEKQNLTVLAFSIGGTIAWKAALLGLKVQTIFAISSTRLRYETQKPNCCVQLFYGENDAFRPNKNWFPKMNLTEKFYKNELHNCYRKNDIADQLCREIVEQLK